MEKEFLTMIPGTIGGEYKSNAEKKVFRFLKETPLKGFAFHSVGLPEHEKKSYSEADFIVLSRCGVLCLEVKDGGVDCQNGVWTFQDRYGRRNTKNEGPFDQAEGALFAFKTAIVNSLPWTKDISFATGIIFTDIKFDYRGVSVIPEIIYDYSSTKHFSEYIKDCHSYWDNKNHRNFAPLTDEEMEEIKCFIRDDLHFVPSLRNVVDSVENELVRLTEEQIQLLDNLNMNKRLIIHGPAGSGKTLLAFDYAKKCADSGKRVLYLVYNKILALFLDRSYTAEYLTIKHFHGMITDYVSLNPNRLKDPTYYSSVLPEQFAKYLSSHKMALYDTLIIDEGQDLICPKSITVWDKLLKGGLYGGNWIIFYDQNQNLFNLNNLNRGLEQLHNYRPATFTLSRNCRNTEPIAMFNKHCSGIDGGKALVSGNEVEFCSYEESDYTKKLDILFDELFKAELKKDDIVILSPFAFEKSKMKEYNGKYLKDIEMFDGGFVKDKIRFATIQSFKGLDSKVVLGVDMEHLIDNNQNILIYTLISRARTLLYMIVPAQTETKIKEKIFLSISKNGDR